MRRLSPNLPSVCLLWALAVGLAASSSLSLGDSITYCPFDQLTCQNGGVLNSTNCQASIPCQIPPLSNWYSEVNCTCPSGYIGTDCQLVATPGSICGTNTTFDVTYFNTSVSQKHIECFIHSQFLPRNITLRSHRISVDLTTNNVGLGNIKFVLSSRHTDGSSSPAQCSIQQVDLECDFQSCQGSSPSNGDQYICQRGSCESCAAYNGSNCDPYWLTIAQSVTMPATILFDLQDPSRGFARLSLFAAGATDPLLTSACLTGACVILDQYVPSNNSNWLIIVVVCSAMGVLSVCLGGACLLNRRAKGDEVVDDLSDPDAVSAPASHRSGQVVYPLSSSRSVSKLSDIMAAHHSDLPKFGVVFDVITYDVTLRARFWQTPIERRILHGVTGVVRPGQLVAIMGSSGAGKSSLMNIISQRVQTGRIGGDIALISDTMKAKRISHVVSYVLQDDRLMTTQTVREAMLFSARMRLPPKFTESMIRAKVNRMIRQLRLDKVADSRIGGIDEGGGISGGERKRLAIGIELLADPRILLLDEPTSGLDSVSAHVVMKVLRNAAEHGCACILSIHQPPAKVFNMFDSVLLLTRLGEQAFFGSPNAALAHMNEIGYPEADQWVNPAEYLLDIASQESVDALKRLPRAFYSSRHYNVLSQMIENVKRNNVHTQVALSDDDDLQTPLMSPASGRVRRRSLLQQLMGDKFESPRPAAAVGANAAAENSPLPPGDRLSRQSSGNALFGSSMPEPQFGSVLAQSDDAMISISAIDDTTPRMALPLPLPSAAGFASPAVDSGRSSASAQAPVPPADLPLFRRKQASKFQKFAMLSWRTFLNNYRDPSLLGVQGLVTTIMAWLIAGVYWHLDIFMPGIQNRAGGLFFIVLYFILVSMSSLGALAEERVLFQRERSSDFYTTMPYFMSKLVCDFIPLRIMPPLVFGVIVYKFMWLHAGATQFMLFLLILVLVNLTATSACFFLSSVIHDPGEVNLAASLFFIYCLLYGGLLLNNDTGGSKLVALKYGSFYHYAWEALMINEFTDLTVVFNPEGFGNTILNGDVVLSNFGLDQDSFFLDIYVLIAFCIFFLFGAYMFLLPDKPHVQWVGHDPFVVSRYLSEAKADAAVVAAVELPTPPSHKRTIRQSSASALPTD